jgi:micrococcal nuclease
VATVALLLCACSSGSGPTSSGSPPISASGTSGTASGATGTPGAAPASGPIVPVERVVDGDTIIVRLRGDDVRVRLTGVDSPESVKPDTPVQCFALAASHFTTSRLTGKRIRLEFDVERYDRFGRTLAYVWLGPVLFNEDLVELGYAVVATFPPDVKYVDRFLRAQRDARGHDRGLWRACPG